MLLKRAILIYILICGVLGGHSKVSAEELNSPIASRPNGIFPSECRNTSVGRPVEGKKFVPESETRRPIRGVIQRDPHFGTCIIRASDSKTDSGERFMRVDYSRRQSFNANGKSFILASESGSWHLYDTKSLLHLRELRGLSGDAEPQWDPSDPNVVRYFPRNGVGMRIYKQNVVTGEVVVEADLADRLRNIWPRANAAWTKSEGSPSADGRYWCLMVDDSDWKGLGFIVWDRIEDKIVGSRSHTTGRPDSVTMSPSGRWCIVTSVNTVAYSRDLQEAFIVRKGGEHADIALGMNGDDVYVSVDYDKHGGPVFMVNLNTKEREDLFESYIDGTATAMHFSGKAYRRPGWVVISTYADYSKNGAPREQWLHRKILLVSLSVKPKIFQLAHHQSRYMKYWTEPHATVDQALGMILFNSNWGVRSETDVDAYLVLVPDIGK